MAVSIVSVCGLLLCATSSSKMNGLNKSFQCQSQEWLLGRGYVFHFLMMWLFSVEEDWWQTVEDWQYVYQNKNTWKFKLSLLDMFHYLLYGENFRRVKALGFLIESRLLMKLSTNVWSFTYWITDGCVWLTWYKFSRWLCRWLLCHPAAESWLVTPSTVIIWVFGGEGLLKTSAWYGYVLSKIAQSDLKCCISSRVEAVTCPIWTAN